MMRNGLVLWLLVCVSSVAADDEAALPMALVVLLCDVPCEVSGRSSVCTSTHRLAVTADHRTTHLSRRPDQGNHHQLTDPVTSS